MKKYLSVFKISRKQEFTYKLNFVMWRLRNIIQILLLFYLWDAVFRDPGKEILGYDRSKMLTYVFGIIIVKAFVMSSRATDVSGEISRGELSNYLVKPVDYFKYWFTRDLSSKSLNLFFATIEILVLFVILKPEFYIQTNFLYFLGFVLALTAAILIYSLLIFIVSSITFWLPELGWGAHFLITVVTAEFLSGSVFPLDLLPGYIQSVIYLTPFPYLVFFPLQIYLGAVNGILLVKGFFITLIWLLGLYFLMKKIWTKGLVVYEAYGK